MAEYYKCDSCEYETDNQDNLKPFRNFFSRVQPAERIVMPAGDCPECGAFCYVQKRYYNHLFTISFTVVSENDGQAVTMNEFYQGLKRRVEMLNKNHDELEEATDLPDDTYPTNHEEYVQWLSECKDCARPKESIVMA